MKAQPRTLLQFIQKHHFPRCRMRTRKLAEGLWNIREPLDWKIGNPGDSQRSHCSHFTFDNMPFWLIAVKKKKNRRVFEYEDWLAEGFCARIPACQAILPGY